MVRYLLVMQNFYVDIYYRAARHHRRSTSVPTKDSADQRGWTVFDCVHGLNARHTVNKKVHMLCIYYRLWYVYGLLF